MRVPFSEIPDKAQVWIYIADRRLTDEEAAGLVSKLEAFLGRWRCEGKEFQSAYDFRENQILAVTGITMGFELTGCTRDALKKMVEKWDETLKVNFTKVPKFCYRGEGQIETRSLAGFKADIKAGRVTEDTVVLDNTVLSLATYRAGIESKVLDCWWYRKAWDKAKQESEPRGAVTF